jgi:methyl-accepting chemotaxis protein
MKLRVKLTLIIALMTAAMISTISFILLRQANILQTRSAFENTKNMAYAESVKIQGGLEDYLNTIETVAGVFNSFKEIEMSQRRQTFDKIMYNVVKSNSSLIGMYSVWKPGIIDNGPPVYSTLHTRERSTVEQEIIVTADFSEWNKREYDRCQQAISANEAWPYMLSVPLPFVNRGKDTFTVLLTTPIIDNVTKELYGFIGTRVDIAPIQEYVRNLAPYETGQAQLISPGGIITASQDPEMLGKDFHEAGEELFGPGGLVMIDRTLETGVPTFTRYHGNIIANYPVKVSGTKSNWGISVEIPFAEQRQMQNFTIFLALIMVIITAVIVYVIVNTSLKPLINVSLILKDISQGEGDLTKSIPVKGNDVITDISSHVNQTLVKIKNLVINIKKEAGILFEIGGDLSQNMSNAAAAVHEINANIQSINTRIKRQGTSVTETHDTMGHLVTGINGLDEHIEKQSSSISRASSAIEQMVANIRSVTDTLIKNGENVRTLTEASEVGRAGLQEVSSDIQEIARESEGLLEINSVMENIASQTNLLSMNAAIEAAHAGESGKGFAVVAAEIRKLAESSSAQSKTIGNVLKKIKTSIDKITKSTENVLSKFEAIDTSVKTVSQQEDIIRNAMEEQGQGSKQILEGVGEINEITRQVKGDSRQMLEEAKDVIKESENLERATYEITTGMEEMTVGADHINVSVNQVNEIGYKNREAIDTLMKEVSRFRVE